MLAQTTLGRLVPPARPEIGRQEAGLDAIVVSTNGHHGLQVLFILLLLK
jgi:hypothetical protein